LLIRLAIAAGLIAWLVSSDAISWGSLAGLITRWPTALAALATLIVGTVVTALRLPVLLRAQGFVLRPWPAVALTVIGLFFGIFLPGSAGGDLAKVYYSVSGQRHGTRAELATVVLFDRAIGMWAMFAMPLLAWPFFASSFAGDVVLTRLVQFSGAVFVGGSIALLTVMLAPAGISGRLPSFVRKDVLLRSLEAVRSYRRHPGALAGAFGVSVAAHAIAISTVALITAAIVPESVSPALALVVPLGFVANALPITPGGLGVGEAAFDRLFLMVGLDGGAEVALGWRAGILLTALIGGLLYVRGWNQAIHAAQDAVSELEASE